MAQEQEGSYNEVDATAPALPGIFGGLGDQVEGPIGHDDINPILFGGVIYDLSAGGESAQSKSGTQNS